MAIEIETASQLVLEPINALWNSFILYLPGLIGALVLLIIGYIIGHVVGKIIIKLLTTLKIDAWIKKFVNSNAIAGITISKLSGELVKWWIFIAFLASASQIVELDVIAILLFNLAEWAPHLIVAVIIMATGLIAADYAAKEISNAKKFKYSNALGVGVKLFVTVFFALYALREIGLNIVLAETTLLMLIGGIVLALAIGFGLGLKVHAEQIIGDIRKEIK